MKMLPTDIKLKLQKMKHVKENSGNFTPDNISSPHMVDYYYLHVLYENRTFPYTQETQGQSLLFYRYFFLLSAEKCGDKFKAYLRDL